MELVCGGLLRGMLSNLITWGKKRKQQKYKICLREDEIQLFSDSEQKPSKELKTMAEERGAGGGG